MVPALLGLFAIGEVIRFTVENGSIARPETARYDYADVVDGVRFVLTHPRLFIQSSLIGVITGLVPGVGGVVANFLSYLAAVRTSDSPADFGSGNPEGVVASEAANDAKDGGALLPTVAFGIPGSAIMAVLLAGLLLHGLTPGQGILTDNQDVLFVLILSLLFSNVLTSIIGLGIANTLRKVTAIPLSLLSPPIVVVSIFGTYAIRHSIGDVALAIAFGLLGFVMVSYDYSRVAVVLALILTPIAENSFHLSLQISENSYLIFFTRPISLLIVGAILIALLSPVLGSFRAHAGSGSSQSGWLDWRFWKSIPEIRGRLRFRPGIPSIGAISLLDVDRKQFDKVFVVVLCTFVLFVLADSVSGAYHPKSVLYPLVVVFRPRDCWWRCSCNRSFPPRTPRRGSPLPPMRTSRPGPKRSFSQERQKTREAFLSPGSVQHKLSSGLDHCTLGWYSSGWWR